MDARQTRKTKGQVNPEKAQSMCHTEFLEGKIC